MASNPFAPDFQDLPQTLPIFPLPGVLLLPRGQLPLNIFEPRHLNMVEDAMRSDRLIGMIQPQEDGEIYKTGCAGKITSFDEQDDGRFLITLTGICRFDVAEELDVIREYRRVSPDWGPYQEDIDGKDCLALDRERLLPLLKTFFDMHDLTCSWEHIEQAPDQKLITCLSMICPLDPGEKQALLESPCCTARAKLFTTMLEMAVKGRDCCSGKCH